MTQTHDTGCKLLGSFQNGHESLGLRRDREHRSVELPAVEGNDGDAYRQRRGLEGRVLAAPGSTREQDGPTYHAGVVSPLLLLLVLVFVQIYI